MGDLLEYGIYILKSTEYSQIESDFMTAILFSVIIGIATVVQGGLNRKLMHTWGLFPALVYSSAIVLILSLALYWLKYFNFQWLTAELSQPTAFQDHKLWYIIPGLCGLIIIVGIPLAIAQIGATQVFITVVVAQVLASVAWDKFHDHIELTPLKITGAALGLLSVVLINWKN